jgi:hypothetical protein
MILTKSSRDVERVLHRASKPDAAATYVTSYLGPSRGADAAPFVEPPLDVLFPVAYLIESAPFREAAPHFHHANQFQVVVRGGGHIGKHAVGNCSVHYASAYTPYGPISPGADGIAYMTMRNAFDPGAKGMPRERELLKRANRKPRAATSERVESLSEAELAAAATACVPVLAEESDGLAAWDYRLAPGATVTGPDPRRGGGQYWLVIGGELAGEDGAALPRLSCVFVSPDEVPFAAVAGAHGCEVLALQFPAGIALR